LRLGASFRVVLTAMRALREKSMSMTVVQYVLARLKAIGVSEVFGVPGDFAFPINDAVVDFSGMEWVGCCNELNAAYAADGYARIRGVGAVSTTYGVGELSAINAIAGAYAERVPVFHLVGMPNVATQAARVPTHHTLGNGEFELFRRMAEHSVRASAILTPQNVAYETERLIAEALYHRGPVYMAMPADVANQQVAGKAPALEMPVSDETSLREAADSIVAVLERARRACVLPGFVAARIGAQNAVQAFVDASGLPFATMFMDKAVLDERQPAYIGMYDGRLMDEPVRSYVEECDCVVAIGTIMSDFNTGAFTSCLDPRKMINIRHHRTDVGAKIYPNVEMQDVLAAVTRRIKAHRGADMQLRPASPGSIVGHGRDPITAQALYPRWSNFLRPNDILVAETGTVSMGLAFALMPKGATFHNQTLWSSIGWATPAAFGAAVAAPDRRLVLVTGEGSHQMTAQEIGQFGRRGLKPIVFVLNNSGYLIERLLCKDPDISYNDLASWKYSLLPNALGCGDWYVARVTTCGELDQALEAASTGLSGAYIEVVTDKYAASTLAMKLHESVKTLYLR
jgi:indolepyruvate decarboxylase